MISATLATILIVDDSPANLNVLFDVLKEAGFKVLVAQSGTSALQKVECTSPDLILLDILMPAPDGFETCRILKQKEETKEIPIIFMTALSDTVDKVRGLQLGAVDYITKPFQHEEVLARIQLHLKMRNLTRQVQAQNLQLEQEIRERIQVEEALRQREAQLQLITDSLPVLISYVDRTHYYRFVNRGYEEWFQLPKEQIQNRHMQEILGDEMYDDILPHLNRALAGQVATFSNTLTHNGRLHYLRETYVPDRRDQGVFGAYVLIQDVTEQQQLEQQLLRSQRMESLGTLASGIAHDLNNVLTPILLSVQLLAMQSSDEQSLRWLELLESNARRGAELIRQVMLFVRGVDGKHVSLRPEQFVSEIAKIVREIFPKSIHISTHIASDLWSVFGDATHLHQVLMNLCVNARDAMPNGGELTITADNVVIKTIEPPLPPEAKPGSYVVVRVKDTGCGIPVENLDRIFEPFFTTKEFGKGTGLGLSTVLGIVRSHNGFITVIPAEMGGTQFSVFLPAFISLVSDMEDETEIPVGHGETILIVDDELAIREITQSSLEAHGYHALTAKDGVEALSVYMEQSQAIDLVMVDMMMPSMDGPLAIRALRKINPDIRIVAVTGLAPNDTLRELTGTDVHAFLPKPFTAKDLLKTLNQVVTSASSA
ncbi:ATP-binding response regulator [Leptolyngbya sp. AN02str]|uniref:ATP-binding response regulator n=1 Tax=Leptolyngbya sp. AN02str TaxID=3423363 RepID=UPI003D31DBA0